MDDDGQVVRFVSRIALTVFLLFFAMLIAPVFVIGVQQARGNWGPMIRTVVCTLACLYLLVMVSVWWSPRWVDSTTQLLSARLQAMGFIAALIVVPVILCLAVSSVIEFIKVW